MKTILNLALAAASVGFGVVLPAWSADAPAASATQAGAKPAASASAPAVKEKKGAVAPHNHMRDGKGQWVPEKKARKEAKKDDTEAAKPPAEGEGKK